MYKSIVYGWLSTKSCSWHMHFLLFEGENVHMSVWMKKKVSFGGGRGSMHRVDVAICCPQLAVATSMGPANLTHLDNVSVVLSFWSNGVCICMKASSHSMAHRDPSSRSHLVFQKHRAKSPNRHTRVSHTQLQRHWKPLGYRNNVCVQIMRWFENNSTQIFAK